MTLSTALTVSGLSLDIIGVSIFTWDLVVLRPGAFDVWLYEQRVETAEETMLSRPINEVTEGDLKALVANKTSESQTLDFKKELPGRDERARHEFCADVCALANASGGDLIFGLDEDDQGSAQDIVPTTSNPDDGQLRLQDMMLNGLEPRVTGVHVRAISVAGGHVFVVRVPKSWSGPHRVKTNQHFFLREGARKRQLDMPEIKSAFARSEGIGERLRQFRVERISKILTSEAPVPLPANVPLCVLHLLPVQPVEGALPVDPRSIVGERRLPVIGSGGYARLNLDGALQYSKFGPKNEGIDAYTQLFRDGRVEAVHAFVNQLEDGKFSIPSTAYERELIQFYDRMEPQLAQLKVSPPLVIFFSLLRTDRAHFAISRERFFFAQGGQGSFDRDTVLLPDILVESSIAGQHALRPIFDLVWQSVGFDASPNYDDKGNWRPNP